MGLEMPASSAISVARRVIPLPGEHAHGGVEHLLLAHGAREAAKPGTLDTIPTDA